MWVDLMWENRQELLTSEIITLIDLLWAKFQINRHVVRIKISAVLLNQKPNVSNLSKEEINVLKQLRKDRKDVITRPHKGDTTVDINNSDYEKYFFTHQMSHTYYGELLILTLLTCLDNLFSIKLTEELCAY